jgi:hypothetical protein
VRAFCRRGRGRGLPSDLIIERLQNKTKRHVTNDTERLPAA